MGTYSPKFDIRPSSSAIFNILPKVSLNLNTFYNEVFFKLPDCAVGEWGEWDSCDDRCGRTTTIRRKVVNGEYSKWDAFVNGGYLDLTDVRDCPFLRACELDHQDY